jgi:hypothetical protein
VRGVIFRLLAGLYSQSKGNSRQLDLPAFAIQTLHASQEYMVYGKVSTPTEKPWIINLSEASLVEAGG